MVFDTFNGIQDYKYDKKLGLKGCAVAFEKAPKLWMGLCSALTVAAWTFGGITAGLGSTFFLSQAAIACHFAWQVNTMNYDDQAGSWTRFLSNKWIGILLLLGILGGKYQKMKKEGNFKLYEPYHF